MSLVQYQTKQDAGLVREKKTVVVDRELDRLYKKDGVVTPAGVLDAARTKTSPLHDFFEWDDSKAAEKYRLSQAMEMILASKFVAVLRNDGKSRLPQVISAEPVRRFLPQFGGGGFKMRNDALNDVEDRTAIIERKKSQLRSWCKGVIDIPELEDLRKMIEAQLSI